MSSRRFAALATCICLALGLVACGGGGGDSSDSGTSEEDQVTQVTQDYFDGLLGGDAGKACDLLTEDARKQIEKLGDSCDKTLESLGGLAPSGSSAEVGDVKVDGDKATADVTLADQSDTIDLEKVDGEWKVAGP